MSDTEEWDPSHETLRSLDAPHETGGLLRMYRSGFGGKHMMRVLRMRGPEVMIELRHNLDAESEATEADVPIHDEQIKDYKL